MLWVEQNHRLRMKYYITIIRVCVYDIHADVVQYQAKLNITEIGFGMTLAQVQPTS